MARARPHDGNWRKTHKESAQCRGKTWEGVPSAATEVPRRAPKGSTQPKERITRGPSEQPDFCARLPQDSCYDGILSEPNYAVFVTGEPQSVCNASRLANSR